MAEDKRRRRARAVELSEDHLLIQWQDGHASKLPLEDLRRECPCAVCREHRGVQAVPPAATGGGAQLQMLSPEAAAATAVASGFDYVGRYGIRITWADGHDTGIYVFEALRERDDA